MIKNDYEVRAKKFIHIIHPFLQEIEINEMNEFDIEIRLAHFNRAYHRAVKMRQGASRFAFITSDYVVKIDKYTHSSWGTSEDEVLAYNKAKEIGREYLLAKITKYIYEDRTYYIMPKVSVCENHNYKRTKDAWDALNITEQAFIDNNFGDLHQGNEGTYKGHYVLLDYALNIFSEKKKRRVSP